MSGIFAQVHKFVEGIPSTLKLEANDRRFVREGGVSIHSAKKDGSGVWRPSYCYLFSDVLLYAEPKINSITSALYTYSGHVWLAGVSVVADPSPQALGLKQGRMAKFRKHQGVPKEALQVNEAGAFGRQLQVAIQFPTLDDKQAWISTLRGLTVKLPSASSVAAALERQQSLAVHARQEVAAHAAAMGSDDDEDEFVLDGGAGSDDDDSDTTPRKGAQNRREQLSKTKKVLGASTPDLQKAYSAVASFAMRSEVQTQASVHRPTTMSRNKLMALLGNTGASGFDDPVLLDVLDHMEDEGDGSMTARDGALIHAMIAAGDSKGLKRALASHVDDDKQMEVLNEERLSPLAAAVRTGNLKIVSVLLEFGNLTDDELNIRDEHGYTPLHWAAREASDAIVAKLLSVGGVRAHVRNLDGNTPLHYMCERCKSSHAVELGQRFVDRGALVNATNNNGETALHKVMFNNTSNQHRIQLVRWLLANHADPNIASTKGDSPLHYAVYMAHSQLVLPLLQGGANMDAVSATGATPIEIARREQKPDIVTMLQEYRAKFSAGLQRLKDGLAEHGLLYVLLNRDLNRQLFAFQESRLCGECVMFWNAVCEYELLKERAPEERKVAAQALWNVHFDPNSEHEVNLSSKVRQDIRMLLGEAPPDLFETAKGLMFNLMLVNLRSDGLKVKRAEGPNLSLSPPREHVGRLVLSDDDEPRDHRARKHRHKSLSSSPNTTPRGTMLIHQFADRFRSAIFDEEDLPDAAAGAVGGFYDDAFPGGGDAPGRPLPRAKSDDTPEVRATTSEDGARARVISRPMPRRAISPEAALSLSPASSSGGIVTMSDAIKHDDGIRALELLRSGEAFLDKPDKDGVTVLSAATKAQAVSVLRTLLDQSQLSDPRVLNFRDGYGFTALHWATRVRAHDTMDGGEAVLRLLLSQPALNVNARNDDGNTPLHFFCEYTTKPHLLDTLVERGADLRLRNENGEAMLHKAVLNRREDVGVALVRKLLAAGADVDVQSLQMETPLHYAVHVGSKTLPIPLLVAGADASRRTCQAQTALDLAMPHGQAFFSHIRDLLTRAGAGALKDDVFLVLEEEEPQTPRRGVLGKKKKNRVMAKSTVLLCQKDEAFATVVDALLDEERCKGLLEHMALHHTPGTVLFLSAVLRYRQIESDEARLAEARSLYDQHLAFDAPQRIALEKADALVFGVYQEIEEAAGTLFDAVFDAAVASVVKTLAADNFCV